MTTPSTPASNEPVQPFPAGDPNAPAAVQPAPDGEGGSDPGPIRFPTQADHPPTREERIRAAAFRHFLERAGEPGDELRDWLKAEEEVDREDASGR